MTERTASRLTLFDRSTSPGIGAAAVCADLEENPRMRRSEPFRMIRWAVISVGAVLMATAAAAQTPKAVCSGPSNYATNCSTPVPDCTTSPTHIDCRGMEQILPGYAGASCTANDTSVVLVGLGVQEDGCINPTDRALVRLQVQISTNATTRYDLAWFLPTDATGTGRTGAAQPGYLYPVSSSSIYSPGPPGGPFNDSDTDFCGEAKGADGITYFNYPFPVGISCQRVTGGFLSLPRCVVWDQSAGQTCSDIRGTGTNNAFNSKCNCSGSAATDIPGPNLRLNCDSFNQSRTFQPNVPSTFTIDYTNSVPGCTPGTPGTGDPFGRFRCGTASFVRFVMTYNATANSRGLFEYHNGSSWATIPGCGAPAPLPGGNGALCNDSGMNRLIWAPQNSITNFAYGVVGPFSGTRSLPLRYTLTDTTSTAGLSFGTRIWWDNVLDTNNNGAISAVEAVTLGGTSVEQNCGECSCSMSAATTPVTLASFLATQGARGVQFDWSTETEVGNVGFNLYALVGDETVRLNGEPIPTRGGDSLLPQLYTAFFAVPDDARGFLIEDLDLRGTGKLHGPFELGEQYGATTDVEPIEWRRIRREHGFPDEGVGRPGERVGQSRPHARTSAQAVKGAPGEGGSLPVPIELHVDRTGLHRVTYEALAAAGFDLGAASASQIGLTAAGAQVPIYVSASSGKFGPGSYFEFWGEALDTLYTKTNVYRLVTGQKKPARAAVSTTAPSGESAVAYPETRRLARNRAYAVSSPGSDPFYDTRLLVGTAPAQWSFQLDLDRYAPNGGSSRIEVDLYGGTSIQNISPDHHVQILLNGTAIGETFLDGLESVRFGATIPDGVLQEGANTVTLRLPADTGAPFDIVYFEGLAITYPRALEAQAGRLDFSGSSRRFDVAALPSADVVAYRRSAGGLTRLAGTTVVAAATGFLATVPGDGTAGTFAIGSAESLLAPKSIQSARAPIDITTGQASYLILAHDAFIPGIQPLAGARASQGYSVKIVDVEDVYSQFAGGVFEADAIRAYIAHAYRSMGTRHVLLVGGDTYDYHDYLGLAPVSFVPSLYRATSDEVRFAPADPAFADVDGDGLQDLAIGRFPVRTVQELANMVEKTLQYAQKDYDRSGIFIADHPDPSASQPFSTMSDLLVDKLPSGWQVEKIYLDSLSHTEARARFFSSISAGAALTYFLGHSGTSSWGTPAQPQPFFTIHDVATLANESRPTAVAQMGCWNNYYVSPRTESLGSRLVLVENKGAAAVLGAVTLSRDSSNNRIGSLLAPALVEPGATLGAALVEAKRGLVSRSPSGADLRDVLNGWTLLGDPALEVTP